MAACPVGASTPTLVAHVRFAYPMRYAPAVTGYNPRTGAQGTSCVDNNSRNAAFTSCAILAPSTQGFQITGTSPAGSLAAGTYGFGMTDGKAFQTVYVRLADGANPNSKADGFVYCIN